MSTGFFPFSSIPILSDYQEKSFNHYHLGTFSFQSVACWRVILRSLLDTSIWVPYRHFKVKASKGLILLFLLTASPSSQSVHITFHSSLSPIPSRTPHPVNSTNTSWVLSPSPSSPQSEFCPGLSSSPVWLLQQKYSFDCCLSAFASNTLPCLLFHFSLDLSPCRISKTYFEAVYTCHAPKLCKSTNITPSLSHDVTQPTPPWPVFLPARICPDPKQTSHLVVSML